VPGPTSATCRPDAASPSSSPAPYMHGALQRRAAHCGIDVQIRSTTADAIDLDDQSADAVISSLLLCTVADPGQVVSEIRPILRPGGRYAFLEHAGAPDGTPLRGIQRAVRRPWAWVFEGCSCERDLAAVIRAAGFASVEIDQYGPGHPVLAACRHRGRMGVPRRARCAGGGPAEPDDRAGVAAADQQPAGRRAVTPHGIGHSPAAHVRRPRVDYESHAVALDRNELGALLVAAGLGPPAGHALICLLALNGLRVPEAASADIEHLGLERGHRTLTITRKAGKVVTIALAPRTSRVIGPAVGERGTGRYSWPRTGGGQPGMAPGGSSARPPQGGQGRDTSHAQTCICHCRAGCRGPAARCPRGRLAR
jgi:Methyltransferase domain